MLLRLYEKSKTARWIFFGFPSTLLNTLAVYVLDVRTGLSELWVILLSAEISLSLRFFLNNLFVFKYTFTFKRLIKFHLVSAFSLAIYFLSITIFRSYYDISLLWAANSAILISLVANYLGSFFWVWVKK